jgi:DNA mismatch endonuclease (patch repair protein)
MRAQRRRDTAPEVALRRRLHALGLRYRLNAAIPGTRRTIDIAFRGARVAVDVRGCYWHGCPDHGTLPMANAQWWQAKISRNRDRDDDTRAILEAAGWRLVVVWEHEDPDAAVVRVATAVRTWLTRERET